MADPADPPAKARRRSRLRPVALAAGAATVVVVAVLAVVWLSRNGVGERLAVDYLRRRGIPATVRLTRVDAGGVAGSLTLGPANAPTLTVDRFEAEFAPGTVVARQPRLARLVLVRPRLSLRFDGRKLDFGALQPLVDEALRAPSGAGGGPDVRVEDGRLTLATPYGRLLAEGAADLNAGRLRRADLRLAPTTLRSGPALVSGLSGTMTTRVVGADALSLQARLAADSLSVGAARATTVALTADGLLPYRSGPDPFSGHAVLKLIASAAQLAAPGGAATGATVQADAAGTLGLRGGASFGGTLTAEARAPDIRIADARLRLARFTLDLARLSAGAAGLDLQGRAGLMAAGGEARLAGERAALGPLAVSASGQALNESGRWSGQGRAALKADAGLAAAAAARLAGRWAPGPYGADLRPALARALSDLTVQARAVDLSARGGSWRAALAQPAVLGGVGVGLTVAAASHAQGDASGVTGALVATAGGGGLSEARAAVSSFRYAHGALDARLDTAVRGSAGPLREVSIALPGAFTLDGRGVRFLAARCGDVLFGRFMGDKDVPLASDGKGRLCPAPGAPLLTAAGGRWAFAGGVEGLSLAAPPAKLAIAEAGAQVRMQGDGPRLTGAAQVAHALVRDTDTPRRFNPLTVSGPAKLAREVWTAQMTVALAKGERPLGSLSLSQDTQSGAGSLHLDAPNRTFAPDGLQPAAVLPALTALATEVSGHADVTLDLGWQGEATTAAVHVVTADMQGKTSGGLAKGVKTDLHITGLDPLASQPTRVTVERLETVVPLTDLSATYVLGKDVVDVSDAQATLAGGRVTLDPLRVGLLPEATIAGVVRADGVQIGGLLDAVNLSRAVQIDARLQGVLPFSLGPKGLRVTQGRLAAMGPGRLTLNREALTGVAASGGEATATATGAGVAAAPVPAIPPPQTSAVQDFAFQALEDLAFSELSADVGSRPGGRLGVVFHVKGRHDPPQRKEARVGVLDLLRGKAFDKPIPLPKGTEVNLTLDSSLNVDDLLAAYAGLSKTPGSAQVQP